VVAVSEYRGLLITNLRSRNVLDVQECYSGRASSVTPKKEPAVDFDDDAPTTPGQELSTDDPTEPGSWFLPETQEPVRPASDYEMLRLWEQYSTLADVEDRAGQVTACAVTPDGRCVVLGTDYGTLTVWDASNGLGLADLEEHADRITACAITPDGQRVVAGSDQGTVTVWDVDYRRPLCTLDGLASKVDACAVTADGKLGAAASLATLIVWDIERECAVRTVRLDGVVSACTMTNDGRCVIIGEDSGALTVWDIRNNKKLATLDGHTNAILACAVTDDGQKLVSASRDRTLKIWELDAGRAHASVAGHADAVTACVVTQDGLKVVSASMDGTLKLWDATCGRELHTLNDHGAVVSACAVPSEGNLLVSASFDATVKVWDLTTMSVVKTLREHTDPVRACAISEDGASVLSASDTQTLVWDLGEERITRVVDLDKSRSAYVVTLDARRVVTGSHDGLTVWNVSNGAVMVELEDIDRYECAVRAALTPHRIASRLATALWRRSDLMSLGLSPP
jgi:WD40 repeat protein